MIATIKKNQSISYSDYILSQRMLVHQLRGIIFVRFISTITKTHLQNLERNLVVLRQLVLLPSNEQNIVISTNQFPVPKLLEHMLDTIQTTQKGTRLRLDHDWRTHAQTMANSLSICVKTMLKYLELLDDLSNLWGLVLTDAENKEIGAKQTYEIVFLEGTKLAQYGTFLTAYLRNR